MPLCVHFDYLLSEVTISTGLSNNSIKVFDWDCNSKCDLMFKIWFNPLEYSFVTVRRMGGPRDAGKGSEENLDSVSLKGPFSVRFFQLIKPASENEYRWYHHFILLATCPGSISYCNVHILQLLKCRDTCATRTCLTICSSFSHCKDTFIFLCLHFL